MFVQKSVTVNHKTKRNLSSLVSWTLEMYDIYIDIHIYIYMMFIYMIYDIYIAHSTAFSGFNKI